MGFRTFGGGKNHVLQSPVMAKLDAARYIN